MSYQDLNTAVARLPRYGAVPAWTVRTAGIAIRCERIAVHVLLLLLFLIGSIKEGSYPISLVIGATMGACVLGALGRRAWTNYAATRLAGTIRR